MNQTIESYNNTQTGDDKIICNLLYKQINNSLDGATSKIWHGHPVWFINDNPVVGYAKLKNCIQLLFWSGQSFDEPGLLPEGTFKAAQARYSHVDQINVASLKQWLEKAKTIQWDYKNIVKRRGRLERL